MNINIKRFSESYSELPEGIMPSTEQDRTLMLDLLVEAMPLGYVFVSHTLNILSINEAACRIFETPNDCVIGNSVMDIDRKSTRLNSSHL